MGKTDFKKEELRRILPLAWNYYEHMKLVRSTNSQNKINFLLAATSFLSAISIALYINFQSLGFLLSALIQFVALLVLLRPFFLKNSVIPWMELKGTLKSLEEGSFEENSLAALKAFEEGTWAEMNWMKDAVRAALFLIIVSILLLIFGTLLGFLNWKDEYALVVLPIAFLILHFYKKQPDFNFEKRKKHHLTVIESWKNGRGMTN